MLPRSGFFYGSACVSTSGDSSYSGWLPLGFFGPSFLESRAAARYVAIFAALAPIAIVAIPIIVTYVFGRSSGGRTYRVQKSLHGPFMIVWDDEKLHVSGEAGEFRLKWADFFAKVENSQTFLLLESDRLYRFIPKRALTALQIADIRRVANTGRS